MYKNFIFFHIATIGNYYQTITNEIIDSIFNSGLINNIEKIYIGILGENKIILPENDKILKIFENNDTNLYEFPILSLIKKFSINNPECNVLYLHTKGVTNNNKPIQDWRRYMLYFNVYKHIECINTLKKYDACGVDLVNNPVTHYSGNFWWAKCSYIRDLPNFNEMKQILSERHKCEFWICSGNGKYFSMWNSNINVLFCFLISNSQDTINLESVEIIGIKADIKTPITKLNLKTEQIETSYYSQELPLFLNKTPNVTSSTDGGHNQGYTYFRLRGIDQTRINFTLNGIPLNEQEDQGVYFLNYPDFLSSIKNIQIQRGVGTSTNGITSFGGSINFESKNGINDGTDIKIGLGSFNTSKISVENSTGLKNKVAFYTRFSAINTDGYKYHSGNNGYSFFINGGYYGKKDIIKTVSFIGRSKNELAWFGVSEKDIEVDPRTNYNTERENDEFQQSLLSLIYTRSINKYSILNNTIFYNKLNGNWSYDLISYGIDSVNNYILDQDFYGLVSNYNMNRDNTRINVGFNVNIYKRRHSSVILPNVNDELYVNTGYKNDYSAFIKIEKDIKNFIIFTDIQSRYITFKYDGDLYFDKLKWLFINPKIGLNFSFNKSINIYLSIGNTTREPTRTDIFKGIDNPLFYYDIKPESVVDYEFGFNYINKKFDINFNLYYMDFKNEIILIGALGENGLPLMDNVEKSFRSGLELDFVLNLAKNINYLNNISYSYNKIKGEKDFYPLYTPNLILNHGIWFNNNKFEIGIDNKIQSKSYIDYENEIYISSFYTIDFQIGYKLYKKSSVLIRFNNITNQKYYTNGYVIDNIKYLFVNPPFNWFVTLKISL